MVPSTSNVQDPSTDYSHHFDTYYLVAFSLLLWINVHNTKVRYVRSSKIKSWQIIWFNSRYFTHSSGGSSLSLFIPAGNHSPSLGLPSRMYHLHHWYPDPGSWQIILSLDLVMRWSSAYNRLFHSKMHTTLEYWGRFFSRGY